MFNLVDSRKIVATIIFKIPEKLMVILREKATGKVKF